MLLGDLLDFELLKATSHQPDYSLSLPIKAMLKATKCGKEIATTY